MLNSEAVCVSVCDVQFLINFILYPFWTAAAGYYLKLTAGFVWTFEVGRAVHGMSNALQVTSSCVLVCQSASGNGLLGTEGVTTGAELPNERG